MITRPWHSWEDIHSAVRDAGGESWAYGHIHEYKYRGVTPGHSVYCVHGSIATEIFILENSTEAETIIVDMTPATNPHEMNAETVRLEKAVQETHNTLESHVELLLKYEAGLFKLEDLEDQERMTLALWCASKNADGMSGQRDDDQPGGVFREACNRILAENGGNIEWKGAFERVMETVRAQAKELKEERKKRMEGVEAGLGEMAVLGSA